VAWAINCRSLPGQNQRSPSKRAWGPTAQDPGRKYEYMADDLRSTGNRYHPVGQSRQDKGNQVQITTTPSIEGKRITKYCGVLAGEAILGANLFKDLFAGIRDLVGGRSATYERELQRAREIALQELQQRAEEAGANAVVGVDLDYEVLGQNNGMLMVSASGTAVVVE